MLEGDSSLLIHGGGSSQSDPDLSGVRGARRMNAVGVLSCILGDQRDVVLDSGQSRRVAGRSQRAFALGTFEKRKLGRYRITLM